MKFSKKTQYALQALFELAKRDDGEPVTIPEIADAQGISRRFLENILGELRHNGLVVSRRGTSGGYLLAVEPYRISVKCVVEIMDGSISIVDRADEKKIDGGLAFNKLWSDIENSVSRVCANRSIADLVEYEANNSMPYVPNYVI